MCDVCCESWNKTNHKKVACSFCDLVCCRTCVQKYILSVHEDPHCMGCKTRWDREFVDSWCTKKFRNTELRSHRETILFERERALFPDTQPQVERILRMRDIRENIRELRSMLIRLLNYFHIPIPVVDDTHFDRHPDLRAVHEQYTNALIEYEELRTGSIHIQDSQRRFVRKCPNGECRGFMDESWYCGMCRSNFCDKCNEPVHEDHVCDPDAVQTMQLLNKDTKPCPKCGEMIQKTSGCAQMWCTSCETAFDWRTGVICVGKIHNPHYLEFKRKQNSLNREHGDIPCGGLPTYQELRNMENPPRAEILNLRCMLMRMDGELRWRWAVQDDDMNVYIRIKYMLREMDELEFKRELQRRDKLNAKAMDVTHIFQMFLDTSSDELRQYVLGKETDEVVDNLRLLIKYTNEVIQTIHSRYNCVTPRFLEKI
jgi:hypothetical protein